VVTLITLEVEVDSKEAEEAEEEEVDTTEDLMEWAIITKWDKLEAINSQIKASSRHNYAHICRRDYAQRVKSAHMLIVNKSLETSQILRKQSFVKCTKWEVIVLMVQTVNLPTESMN